MNWLQDNPLGRALVYVCGALLLLVIIMTIIWSLPVSVDTAGLDAGEDEAIDTVLVARDIASMNELQVINQKPLFNENRLPEIVVVDDNGGDDIEPEITVTGAPDVKLTGVIITPDMKIATLTPASSGIESVMAHEGESLVGEYVGWKVGTVNPRTVVLTSNDGQQLKLELQVHDTAIKEPPKPVAVAQQAATPNAAGQASPDQPPPPVGEDGQPLSRAEQIRQRIAERREELRLEQEARAANTQTPAQTPARTPSQRPEQGGGAEKPPQTRSAYQDAIRNMMKRKKDDDSNGNTDG